MTTVTITQQHIAHGKRNCSGCPIALALLEAFPEAHEASAGPEHLILFRDKTILREFLTPAMAREFMARFDGGKAVQPLTFVLV